MRSGSRRAERPEHGPARPRTPRGYPRQNRRAGRPRPEGRVRGPLRRVSLGGLLPRRGGRRGVRPHDGPARPRQELRPRHRRNRGPGEGLSGGPKPNHRQRGDGLGGSRRRAEGRPARPAEFGRGRTRRRDRSVHGGPRWRVRRPPRRGVLRGVGLHPLRHRLPGDRDPKLLVQQSPRRVPGVRGHRRDQGGGRGVGGPRPLETPQARLRAVELQPDLLPQATRQRGRPLRRERGHSLREPARGRAGGVRLGHRRESPLRVDDQERHPRERRAIRGVIPNLERRYVETDSDSTRDHIEEYMAVTECPECEGTRLNDQSRSVLVDGTSITEVNEMSIGDALDHFEGLEKTLDDRETKIAEEILKEIRARLGFMEEVGLEYLTLDREASTLSGGESQRIRLATQIGSGLVGVLYVLDEPSIGLHQRDNDRLLNTLEELRDLGNTLLVVEHDEATMRRADNVIDMGPGPGKRGGEVVVQGDVDEVMDCEESLTGDYLTGRKEIPVPDDRRDTDERLTVVGARQHNLKDLNVALPVGQFTAITGVSGSGKSTLMHDILYKGLAREMNDNTSVDPGDHDAIEGIENVEKVRLIDQSPIGRTPRSNPATYTGVFDYIRELFAETKLAKQRGYEKGRFSFNVKGGRCEECGGQGTVKIEMNFLSDVYVPCEECDGARYNDETLDVTYKGATIADVLDMSVEEAYDFFEHDQRIARRLGLLKDVGLDYMNLGQPSTTLSGGEAQRVKLAEELGKKDTGDTLYLLDEPTTGLHKADERKLIEVLQRLADKGNTVVVIEHELDLVKNADHVIDLGPEGGENGGEVVASGTPEAVARDEDSHTGRYLRDMLPDVELDGPRADRRAAPATDD
ncbi:excinuclease ABC subunit UvrA [Halorussus caseinilyticus]|uniref:Excinuclease ABC subunit UvrA n=1 Tax=Halorussus caseinilyticus TaxID=3034025 RepID=A0ABD5WLS1_9EURY